MPLIIGEDKIKSIYVGDQKIEKAYAGNEIVYSSSEQITPTIEADYFYPQSIYNIAEPYGVINNVAVSKYVTSNIQYTSSSTYIPTSQSKQISVSGYTLSMKGPSIVFFKSNYYVMAFISSLKRAFVAYFSSLTNTKITLKDFASTTYYTPLFLLATSTRLFLMVEYGGTSTASEFTNGYYYSTDGTTFATATAPFANAQIASGWVYNDKAYVMLKNGAIYEYGTSFTLLNSNYSNLLPNTYANMRVFDNIIIGTVPGTNKFVYSDDGINFTAYDLPFTANESCRVCYFNGHFFVYSMSNKKDESIKQNGACKLIMYSTDLTNWEHLSMPVEVEQLLALTNKGTYESSFIYVRSMYVLDNRLFVGMCISYPASPTTYVGGITQEEIDQIKSIQVAITGSVSYSNPILEISAKGD